MTCWTCAFSLDSCMTCWTCTFSWDSYITCRTCGFSWDSYMTCWTYLNSWSQCLVVSELNVRVGQPVSKKMMSQGAFSRDSYMTCWTCGFSHVDSLGTTTWHVEPVSIDEAIIWWSDNAVRVYSLCQRKWHVTEGILLGQLHDMLNMWILLGKLHDKLNMSQKSKPTFHGGRTVSELKLRDLQTMPMKMTCHRVHSLGTDTSQAEQVSEVKINIWWSKDGIRVQSQGFTSCKRSTWLAEA